MNWMGWTVVFMAIASALAVPTWRPRRGSTVIAAVFAVTFGFAQWGRLSIIVAIVLVGATLAWYVRTMLHEHRAQKWEEAVASYTRVLAAQLQVGSSLPQAFAAAAKHSADTGAVERVQRVAHVASIVAAQGGEVSSALQDIPALARYAHVGQRYGIGMAGLLEHAGHHFDTVMRFRSNTRASVQGPQASAVVLSFLPVAGIGMGHMMGANTVSFLTSGGAGGTVLMVGTALMCAGFIWSKVIILRALS